MSDTPVDDGSDKPTGWTSPDGYLEVRDSVDKTGAPFHGYHETELGAHDRWLRQAPDLFEKYQELLHKFTVLSATSEGDRKAWAHERLQTHSDRIQNMKEWEGECYRLLKAYDAEGKHETAAALKEIADVLREGWQELETGSIGGPSC